MHSEIEGSVVMTSSLSDLAFFFELVALEDGLELGFGFYFCLADLGYRFMGPTSFGYLLRDLSFVCCYGLL